MISKAPARICLFGDHQDYLGLPVIACAIDKYIFINGKLNNSNFLNFDLQDLSKKISINLNDNLKEIEKGDHIKYVLKSLKKNKIVINKGYDIKVKSEIFINAGISSSSALIVALINFFLKIFNPEKISEKFISELAYQSEVIEQGGSGGRMDQYSITIGNTIFLETNTNNSFFKIKSPFKNFIIANSGIKKPTDLVLKNLKEKSIDSINKIKKINESFILSKVKKSEIYRYKKLLDKTSFNYFEAAVSNHHITLSALNELKKTKPNLNKLGRLMNEHHNFLKNNLKITVPKIDEMIDIATKNGAYGAKIIGSGGGGSILILSNENKQENIINKLFSIGVNDVVKANESPGILSL
jgi:galactokinase